MLLRADLKYVCVDFETTGLDIENDEAIQIGIASFDHTGKTLATFASYIKPQKSISELKDMVRVVTGLSLEDIINSPVFADIQDSIEPFFDEKTVIIGHNIQFDMGILKKYMSPQYFAVIDTFPLAQALIPFAPSYALEVLDKSVSGDPKNHNTNEQVGGSSHDALYDAYATSRVFFAEIFRLESILDKYPYVARYLQKSDATLSKIISLNSSDHYLEGAIPVLSKAMMNGKKLIGEGAIIKENLPDKGNYFIGNQPLKEILKKLPKENVIYAFSQRHKVQIAKSLLHEVGLTHIDTSVHHTFDMTLLGLFFKKLSFDQGELYFALKYFYHALHSHSSIDMNNATDRKIYHAIKEQGDTEQRKSAEIITHDQLYDMIRNQEIMPYTSVFFFDQDRRYDTHMKREQKFFDIHILLQITDSLVYRDTLIHPEKKSIREPLYTKLVIFLGIRQTEVAALMKDVSNSAVEVDNLLQNTYFYKTNLIIPQIEDLLHSLKTKATDDDRTVVDEKRKRFRHIISGTCSISTKLQLGTEVRFVVRSLHSFLDYSEFQDIFTIHQTLFLSNRKKDRPLLIAGSTEITSPSIAPRPGKEKIDYSGNNIYVFSNNKQTSQELLVRLHHHKPVKHKVHGENITGGKGKNIFAIKGSSHNIIIGGYDFFLQCIAQKINIDKIYTLCINGPLEHLISHDLLYYGNTTRN